MAFCHQCKTQVEDDTKFCTNCGIEFNQEKVVVKIPLEMATKIEANEDKEEKNFFTKLEMGEYGLAKTFWLYGFLVRVIANGILKFISNKNIFIVCILLYALYELFVMVGIWRAANQYKGLKLWAALAKVAIILGIFAMLVSLPMIVDLFTANAQEKQSAKVVPTVETKPVEENIALIKMQKEYIDDYNTTLITYEYDKQKCKTFDLNILQKISDYILDDIYIGYRINNKVWWFKNTPLTHPQSIYIGCENIENVIQIKEIKTQKSLDIQESISIKNGKTPPSGLENSANTKLSPSEEFFQNGLKAYKEKNYIKATDFFEKSCTGGNAAGCNILGAMYANGEGLKQDFIKAAPLYEKACNGGYLTGCFGLAVLYAKGEGVKKDFFNAILLYEKACNGGYAEGCFNLGLMYTNGEDVKQDYFKAFTLYEKACNGSDAKGCFALGIMHNNGLGVKQNSKKALDLYDKACNMNLELGCKNYATLQKQLGQ